jgi:dolichyl-phosphate-mannose-protein mannosyltransferase
VTKQNRKGLKQPYRPTGPAETVLVGSESPTSRSGLLLAGSPGLSKREALLFGVVLLAGVWLRIVALSHSAIEHFDEGVYASNVFFGAPEYAYPMQPYYAPPLVPALIEAATTVGMLVGMPANLAALLPGFLAGCATIVVVWWFGRCWFGPAVGLSAAALVAFSDFHIAYSAAALTDVLLGVWLVLAVDAIGRSLIGCDSKQRDGTRSGLAAYGDFRWAVGAGLFTGLAWWTKYNGWLPLAIEAAALPLLWFFLRPSTQQLSHWVGCFAVTALIAGIVWSPYYLWLQPHGGYRPIAENHAKYIVGLAGWFDSATRQIANQMVMEHRGSVVGVVFAIVLPGFLTSRSRRERLRLLSWGVGIGALALYLSAFVVAGVAAIVVSWRLLVEFWHAEKFDDAGRRRFVGGCLLIAWLGGMMVATPLYTAYPRLVLPGLLATWIGMALLVAEFSHFENATLQTQRLPGWKSLAALFGVVLVAGIVATLCWPNLSRFHLARDRRGLQQIAWQIRETEKQGEVRGIYVFGEPALFFQLRAAGEEIVAPIPDVSVKQVKLDGRDLPTFLVVGPHDQNDAKLQTQLQADPPRWKLVAEYDYAPSALVWLDLHDPRASVSNSDASRKHAIRFYELLSLENGR